MASSRPSPADDLGPDELRSMLGTGRDSEYVLFDVRQPEEYRAGHIPGARMLPLPEYEDRLEEVWRHRDRVIVFYCETGARSRLAARLTSEGLRVKRSYNLRGGLVAWRGESVTGIPALRLFSLDADASDILTRAIDLEKGVHRFYEALTPLVAGTEQEAVVRELGAAEVGHGRVIYNALVAADRQPAESFEELFERLPGNLLEGGQSWEGLAERIRELGDAGTVALLELALELEYSAYDLYKNLADRAGMRDTRDAFLLLAGQERTHAKSIAARLAALAPEPNEGTQH